MFKLEQKAKESKTAKETKNIAPAQIRLQYDVNELSLPPTCAVEFPNPDDLFNFDMTISPDEGYYEGGNFVFKFCVGSNYPFDPPKIKCVTKIHHPNIDLDGNICLNILRDDWKPVLTINSLVYGLLHLLLEPNPVEPLNFKAAEEMQTNLRLFKRNILNLIHIQRNYVD